MYNPNSPVLAPLKKIYKETMHIFANCDGQAARGSLVKQFLNTSVLFLVCIKYISMIFICSDILCTFNAFRD